MPSNTGLYENSDDESLANELSPTDGYFNRRPSHPRDVLIPDPSQTTTADSDKAREAREESESSAASRRQSHRTTPSTTSGRRFDPTFEQETYTENSPLIPSAPPTYSAATAASASSQSVPSAPRSSSSGEVTHNRYNTMGRQEIFLPTGEPEDLGGGSDGGYEGFGKRSWRNRVRSLFRIEYLFILVALAIGAGFITSAVLKLVDHHKASKNPITGPVSGSPGDRIPNNVFRSCPSGVYKVSADYGFQRPSSFAFVQETGGDGYANGPTYQQINLVGEIHVRPSVDPVEDSIRVSLDIHLSDSAIWQHISWTPLDEGLVIRIPNRYYSESGSSHPCMYVVATIWVSPHKTTKELVIQTQSFSVTVHEGISANMEAVSIDAIAGSVTFPSKSLTPSTFNSREVVVKTISGSIYGSYALYDLLQISSSSGTIDINVDPKDAAERNPLPAKLKLETSSGSIKANTAVLTETFGAFSIPNRDYHTTITSVSGTVTIGLIHGSDTQVHTSSGSIHATLSPYGSIDSQSSIDIKTNSGTTGIEVLSSLSHPGQDMRYLYGSYKQLSGSLSIKYPGEWDGGIEGTVLSGSVNYDWPGLKIIEDGSRGYGFKRFRAYKNLKDARLTFESVSGSVTLKGGPPNTAVPGGGLFDDDDGWNEEPVDEPPANDDEPDMGGAPPSRWPGYSDEWGLLGEKEA